MAVPPTVEVAARNLPLQCPPAGVTAWNLHPRVFLDARAGEARCPYCGTRYLVKGASPKGH